MNIWKVVVIPSLRTEHRSMGGKFLSRYLAEVHDGIIRVMAGLEPVGKDGRLIWHLSFSHQQIEGDNVSVKSRKPTKKEVKRISRELLADVPMRIEDCGNDPNIVHMWQVED